MARVYLGLGSNIDRERNIRAGLDALDAGFGPLAVSPVYDCEAVGFEGQPFLNLVVGIDTELPVGALARQLRQLEYQHGRPENAPRFSPRHLDIDILSYGEVCGTVDGVLLPRPEILDNAYVLYPLADLAPQCLHPGCGSSYRCLRAAMRPHHNVAPTPFSWRGRRL